MNEARNAEKLCEMGFYCDNLIYFDRMDYVGAMNMLFVIIDEGSAILQLCFQSPIHNYRK